MLNRITHGEPTENLPLVIAHGLYGSARNWGVISKRLSADRQVIAVDMRNHGDSFRSPDHSYSAMADDLAETIHDLGGQADLLGHSMGGKAAMVTALTNPKMVSRLIVADIAPVTYATSQQQYVDAMLAVDLSLVRRRSDAEIQLRETVDDAGLRAFFLQSLRIDADHVDWKLNLDVLSDQMAHVTGFPAVEGQFSGRSLFLAGGASDYVTAEYWPLILSLFPSAVLNRIPGAAHWLHAEVPREFVAAVSEFLDP